MWNIVAAIMKIFEHVRTCSKCGNRQIETSAERAATVRCKHCGADIPAKKEDS